MNIEIALDRVVKLLLNSSNTDGGDREGPNFAATPTLDYDLDTDYANALTHMRDNTSASASIIDKVTSVHKVTGKTVAGGTTGFDAQTLEYSSIQDFTKMLQKWSGFKLVGDYYEPVNVVDTDKGPVKLPASNEEIQLSGYSLNGLQSDSLSARNAARAKADGLNEQAAYEGSYSYSVIQNMYRRIKELEKELAFVISTHLTDSASNDGGEYYSGDGYLDLTTTHGSITADLVDLMKTIYGTIGTGRIKYEKHTQAGNSEDARFDPPEDNKSNIVSDLLRELYRTTTQYDLDKLNNGGIPQTISWNSDGTTTTHGADDYNNADIAFDFDFDDSTPVRVTDDTAPLSFKSRTQYLSQNKDHMNQYDRKSRLDALEVGLSAVRRFLGLYDADDAVLKYKGIPTGATLFGEANFNDDTWAPTTDFGSLVVTDNLNLAKIVVNQSMLTNAELGFNKYSNSSSPYSLKYEVTSGGATVKPEVTLTNNSEYTVTVPTDATDSDDDGLIDLWKNTWAAQHNGTPPSDDLVELMTKRVEFCKEYDNVALPQKDGDKGFADWMYYYTGKDAPIATSINEWVGIGAGKLTANIHPLVNFEELTLDFGEPFGSSISGVSEMPREATIQRPRLPTANPAPDVWTNVLTLWDNAKYTNSELKQLEAEFVRRIANLNKRMIGVDNFYDLRNSFNNDIWGTAGTVEYNTSGEVVFPSEPEFATAEKPWQELAGAGINKRLLELERFIWHFVHGTAPIAKGSSNGVGTIPGLLESAIYTSAANSD
jgi:hypothetical protein